MGSGSSIENLTADDFELMRSKSDLTEAQLDELYGRFCDDFPRGYMTRPEFESAYNDVFPDGDRGTMQLFAFRMLDMDGNQFISFHELRTTLRVAEHGTLEEKFMALFRLYNFVRTSKVTRDELNSVLTALYKCRGDREASQKAGQQVTEIIALLDATKRGSLTEDDFVRAAKKCPQAFDLLQGEALLNQNLRN